MKTQWEISPVSTYITLHFYFHFSFFFFFFFPLWFKYQSEEVIQRMDLFFAYLAGNQCQASDMAVLWDPSKAENTVLRCPLWRFDLFFHCSAESYALDPGSEVCFPVLTEPSQAETMALQHIQVMSSAFHPVMD